jgi:hypothetical protein
MLDALDTEQQQLAFILPRKGKDHAKEMHMADTYRPSNTVAAIGRHGLSLMAVSEDCRHKDAKGEMADFSQHRQYVSLQSQHRQLFWPFSQHIDRANISNENIHSAQEAT